MKEKDKQSPNPLTPAQKVVDVLYFVNDYGKESVYG